MTDRLAADTIERTLRVGGVYYRRGYTDPIIVLGGAGTYVWEVAANENLRGFAYNGDHFRVAEFDGREWRPRLIDYRSLVTREEAMEFLNKCADDAERRSVAEQRAAERYRSNARKVAI